MTKYTEFKYNNGGYKWASLVTIVEAEKLSLHIVLMGTLLLIIFFIILSPKISYLWQKQELNMVMSKPLVLRLIVLFIAPHLVIFSVVKLTNPMWLSSSLHWFLLIVLIQVLVVIPLFNALSRHNSWRPILRIADYADPFWCRHSSGNAWGSPIIFLHLSKGMLYPMIFIGYLLIIRYLLLGKFIDMSFLFNLPAEALPITVYFLCYYPCYYLLIMHYLRLRKRLWEHCTIVLDAVNLSIIQHDLLFHLLKNLYLISRLLFDFIYYTEPDQTANRKIKTLSRLFQRLRRISWVMGLISISILMVEIIFTHHLYYSLYYLFILAVIRIIWFPISKFGETHWENSVDLSDYLYHNFDNPHKPREFWGLFQFNEKDANMVGISWKYSESMKKKINELKQKHMLSRKHKFIPYMSSPVGHRARFEKNSFLRQHARDCTYTTGLRFNHQFKRRTHTISALKSTLTLFQRVKTAIHLNTGYLVPNSLCQMLLLQDSYLHTETCRNLSACVPVYNLNMFKYAELSRICNNGSPFVRNFIEFQEYATAAQLMAQLPKNSNIRAITPYKEIFSTHAVNRLQENPDIAFHTNNRIEGYGTTSDLLKQMSPSHIFSPFGGSLLTYDEKSHAINNYGPSPNQIVCVDILDNYIKILNKTKQFYKQRNLSTVALDDYINTLRQTQPTPEDAFKIYIDYMAKFMELPYQPPIWITSHFNVKVLSEAAKNLLEPSENLVLRLSDLLEKNNVPSNTRYNPELEHIKDSSQYNNLLKDYHETIAVARAEEMELLSGAAEQLTITL